MNMEKSNGLKIAHTINGHTFPVLEVLHVEGLAQSVPLLDICMMSDERERELARKGAAV